MNRYEKGYSDGLAFGIQRGLPAPGEVINIPHGPEGVWGPGEVAKAIITAALIIAMAMMGCAVIDYLTFHEPQVYEEEVENTPAIYDVRYSLDASRRPFSSPSY